jgi:hypothetical protein
MSPRARWARAQVEPYLTEHPDGLTQPVTLACQRLDEIGAILTPERAEEIAAEARAAALGGVAGASARQPEPERAPTARGLLGNWAEGAANARRQPEPERPTPERLEEIRAREGAATKGPWDLYEGGGYLDIAADLEDTGCGYRARRQIVSFDDEPLDNDPAHAEWDEEDDRQQILADAAFIAHAREDVPALLAEIDRLKAENAELIQQRDRIADDTAKALAVELEARPSRAAVLDEAADKLLSLRRQHTEADSASAIGLGDAAFELRSMAAEARAAQTGGAS